METANFITITSANNVDNALYYHSLLIITFKISTYVFTFFHPLSHTSYDTLHNTPSWFCGVDHEIVHWIGEHSTLWLPISNNHWRTFRSYGHLFSVLYGLPIAISRCSWLCQLDLVFCASIQFDNRILFTSNRRNYPTCLRPASWNNNKRICLWHSSVVKDLKSIMAKHVSLTTYYANIFNYIFF